MKVEPIEYFYSAYSAYAYIGHYHFLRLAEKAGREVVHRPFDLMKCLNAIGYHPLEERTQATLDYQFIHVDSEKATPLFGSTIAHGFLSLSLIAGLKAGGIAPDNMTMAFNYGLDRVRFLTPVNVGSKVRTKAKLLSVDEKDDGRYLVKNEVSMEIEGQEKPAFIAESLTMFVTG